MMDIGEEIGRDWKRVGSWNRSFPPFLKWRAVLKISGNDLKFSRVSMHVHVRRNNIILRTENQLSHPVPMIHVDPEIPNSALPPILIARSSCQTRFFSVHSVVGMVEKEIIAIDHGSAFVFVVAIILISSRSTSMI